MVPGWAGSNGLCAAPFSGQGGANLSGASADLRAGLFSAFRRFAGTGRSGAGHAAGCRAGRLRRRGGWRAVLRIGAGFRRSRLPHCFQSVSLRTSVRRTLPEKETAAGHGGGVCGQSAFVFRNPADPADPGLAGGGAGRALLRAIAKIPSGRSPGAALSPGPSVRRHGRGFSSGDHRADAGIHPQRRQGAAAGSGDDPIGGVGAGGTALRPVFQPGALLGPGPCPHGKADEFHDGTKPSGRTHRGGRAARLKSTGLFTGGIHPGGGAGGADPAPAAAEPAEARPLRAGADPDPFGGHAGFA